MVVVNGAWRKAAKEARECCGEGKVAEWDRKMALSLLNVCLEVEAIVLQLMLSQIEI